MKKLFLAIAIIGFITFGAIGVQNLVASPYSVEFAKFDKDPKKDADKKNKDSKESTEVKAETTSATSTAKEGCCTSSCSGKSSESCCSKDKSSCSKECPDKK